jgi:hypothetical protein
MNNAVLHLITDKGGPPPLLRDLERLGELSRVEVGASDLPDLAFLDQFVHHLERVLDRCLGVGEVDHEQVDVVGAQLGETPLQDLSHVPGTGAATALPPGDRYPHLGSDHHFVTPPTQRRPEKGLGLTLPIVARGVEVAHPGVEGGIHHRRRLCLVQGPPEVVAPEPDHRNLETPDLRRSHLADPFRGRRNRCAFSSRTRARSASPSRTASTPATGSVEAISKG